MEKIFGIDLGTTNSEIAYMNDGKPEIITVADGRKYLPSVVGVNPKGEVVTGFAARNQHAAYPHKTVVSIKRKIGSGEKVSMAGQEYTPAQISSHILKTLKEAAERETGMTVKKVVITVPAYFNDAQRKETIRAGELAGLEVVRIINEPTAAALAYGCREEHREKILVYDLGGGTFDISLIDVEKDVIEVIATDGDTLLGGDDFDRLLSELFIEHLPEGLVSEKDLRLAARLNNTAESAKIALSTQATVGVREGFLAAVKGKPVNLELLVTRREFEDRIEETLEKTFSLLKGVIGEKKLKSKDIAKVLLVGGSTHIPRISHVLREELDFDVRREVDPTYCVALGAAIQGAIIAGEDIGTILVDVNPHSLGIRCVNIKATGEIDFDNYGIIINRNTPVPTSMSETYYTMLENQKKAVIEVFQGENPRASENIPIGSFALDRLPKRLPAGSEIDVTFEYNLDGIVEIAASERTSGRREQIEIDVNRNESVTESPEAEAAAGGSQTREKTDAKKAARILKTAEKKLSRIEDPKLRKKTSSIMKKLEKALAEEDEGITKLAEELAELIAGT